jgi:phosphoribosyl-ATP pyrophosphohydrolase
MAYREEYNRTGNEQYSRNAGSAWQDFMTSLKEIVEYYQNEDNEHNRRSYGRRYDGGSIGGTMYDSNAYRYDGYDRGSSSYRSNQYDYGRRNQRRNSRGQYTRISISPEEMEMKEELGRKLMEQYGPEWVFEKITSEASELIGAVSKHDKYEMMKEFSELCILMAGMESEMSEEMIEEACRQASDYYMKKVHGEMSPLHRMYYGQGDMNGVRDMYN